MPSLGRKRKKRKGEKTALEDNGLKGGTGLRSTPGRGVERRGEEGGQSQREEKGKAKNIKKNTFAAGGEKRHL